MSMGCAMWDLQGFCEVLVLCGQRDVLSIFVFCFSFECCFVAEYERVRNRISLPFLLRSDLPLKRFSPLIFLHGMSSGGAFCSAASYCGKVALAGSGGACLAILRRLLRAEILECISSCHSFFNMKMVFDITVLVTNTGHMLTIK